MIGSNEHRKPYEGFWEGVKNGRSDQVDPGGAYSGSNCQPGLLGTDWDSSMAMVM